MPITPPVQQTSGFVESNEMGNERCTNGCTCDVCLMQLAAWIREYLNAFEFIRDGATNGDRHRLLFSAAAKLAEFGCSFDLAFALLSESALDTGLKPADVLRQIEYGLKHRKD